MRLMNKGKVTEMKRLLFISMVCLIIAGCGTNNTPESRPVNNDIDFAKDDYKQITSISNSLGFNLLKQINSDTSNNIFVSPTSLLMTMLMVYNGAKGDT